MRDSGWRTEVQSLLEEAAESGEVNLAALAREVGWKPPALHNFRRKGYGEKSKIEALEAKLRQRGFGGKPQPIEPIITDESFADVEDPIDAIMVQMSGLMKLLADKKRFDYATRLALCREGLAGVERHIMPVAERWLEKVKGGGE